MQRTPLGEKIVVSTSRPGLIVGKKGSNIKFLTNLLKTRFGMENPQIEVEEIVNPSVDAASVARTLISGFQKFGPKRFKAMAYKALDDALKCGASGIEVVISGRGVPGERAKTWRFSAGYLKKSGDISASFMDRCYEGCDLKSGTIGIKVSILPSDVVLPDKMHIKTQEKTEKPLTAEKAVQSITSELPKKGANKKDKAEEVKSEAKPASEEKPKKEKKPRKKAETKNVEEAKPAEEKKVESSEEKKTE
jgi:small subunit ribosomal protein S3